MMSEIGEGWMSRKEAARFLTSIGHPTTAQRLANMAKNNNAGKGPSFTRTGWRSVYYLESDLRVWAARRTERVA